MERLSCLGFVSRTTVSRSTPRDTRQISYAVVAYETKVYAATTDPLHKRERDVLHLDRSVGRFHIIPDFN